MTSISSVSHTTPPVALESTASVSPKTVAAPAPAPNPAATPAATLQLSQQAKALLQGDKDWKPGQKVDWS